MIHTDTMGVGWGGPLVCIGYDYYNIFNDIILLYTVRGHLTVNYRYESV